MIKIVHSIIRIQRKRPFSLISSAFSPDFSLSDKLLGPTSPARASAFSGVGSPFLLPLLFSLCSSGIYPSLLLCFWFWLRRFLWVRLRSRGCLACRELAGVWSCGAVGVGLGLGGVGF
ncbi:Uncharacterized protein Rs2_11043 [Raphanus sativus]|nr:Uncharacterized protein Rs2_11043 [Raphanus sativus]